MLLEFKMKNFKSFRNLVEFKMTPAQKIKDLEYSLLKEKANNKEEKALSSSVIYGPNSSGKTNLIGGLQVFKAIVLRGNIKDADDLTSINIATEKLDFIPHIDSKENEPTYFYIKFLTNNMIIEYSITFLTEKLLSKEKDKRKILEEKLKIDGNNIYIRNEKIQIENLEYLKEKGVLAIATTHYQELKKYAMATKGFQNASVEFDVETLTPTYHLLVGIPGKSNAFEISKKLGLREEIIERSKGRLYQDEIDFEELMKQLYNDKRKIEVEKQEIEANLKEVKNLKEKLKQNHTELLEVEQEKIQKAKIEARNIILEAKEEANEIIRKMKEIEKEADIDANKKLNNLRNKLNEDIKEQNQELNTKTQNIDTKKEQVKPGITVYVENLGQQGTVISNVSKDEQVLVQIGSLKMKVQIQNLRIIKDIEPKKQNNISQNYTKIDKTRNAKTEINVIGMNVEEARFVVEKFLDDSILAHLQTVRIVHGKGTGKLRAGIHQMLKKDPAVKSYRMGTFGEGEMGVTVVELKK